VPEITYLTGLVGEDKERETGSIESGEGSQEVDPVSQGQNR